MMRSRSRRAGILMAATDTSQHYSSLTLLVQRPILYPIDYGIGISVGQGRTRRGAFLSDCDVTVDAARVTPDSGEMAEAGVDG